MNTSTLLGGIAALALSFSVWSQSSSSSHSSSHGDTHAHDSLSTEPDASQAVSHGDLIVTQIQSRVTPPGAKMGVGYLSITNTGSEDDILLGGNAQFASEVQVHTMKMVGDVMQMRRLKDGLVIPAGETIKLAPGSDHIMFVDLKEPLIADGQNHQVTLKFARAGEIVLAMSIAPLM